MTSDELREGDLVVLHATAPPMSVQSISADGKTAICMWFDTQGQLHERAFDLRSLRKYSDDAHGVSGS